MTKPGKNAATWNKAVSMQKITEEIIGAKSIGITGHIRPDGDCVGSTLGMYLYLKKVCPADVEIEVILENPPQIFDCIKGFDEIRPYPRRQPYDVFIVIDTSADRIGNSEPGLKKAHKTINIDHHISNPGSCEINYIDPDASSASELVYRLIDEDKIDIDIATAIYIGIAHDTGVMQYSNTSPDTLRIMAKLIEYGFDFPALIDKTFHEKTYVQNQVLGRALTESILFMEGKCIVSKMSLDMMHFYGITSKDMDGIVNQLRYTKGVEVSIFMYELEPMKWKISLRSCGLVNVAKVAEFFGGGGHVRASGCNMVGLFHDVVNNLSAQIALQIYV